jgi:hypothetical protein
MIYNQKHAIFVALAGLFTSASAAPAHHAKSGHTSELLSPGLTEPVKLWTRGVTKEDYPEACMEAWEFFNQERCWCFTGCALDCNHGGWKVDPRRGKASEPGVPEKDLNPEMCEGVTDDYKKGCEELACDLVNNCDEVADDLKPGLDKIVSTGGYTCSAAATATKDLVWNGSWFCFVEKIGVFSDDMIGKPMDILYDGEVIKSTTVTHASDSYYHSTVGEASYVCQNPQSVDPSLTPGCVWSNGFLSTNTALATCQDRFSYQLK